jgi:hypothetical protein
MNGKEEKHGSSLNNFRAVYKRFLFFICIPLNVY